MLFKIVLFIANGKEKKNVFGSKFFVFLIVVAGYDDEDGPESWALIASLTVIPVSRHLHDSSLFS